MTPETTDVVPEAPTYVAFDGTTRLGDGTLLQVAVAMHQAMARHPDRPVLAFDRATGKVVDLDLSGSEADVRTRYGPTAPDVARRGRPKLGVVAREVTLLPRHWEWLARQPGGASVTLRKLIEAARKTEDIHGNARARTAAAYQFMVAVAGDLPGFEEASRALFAGDQTRLDTEIQLWPEDIRHEIALFLGK